MDILIKEIDRLIFGDGRPFNSGENTFRTSINNIFNIPVYSFIKKFFNGNPELEFIGLAKKGKYFIFPFPLDLNYKLVYERERFYLKPFNKDKIKEYKYLNLRIYKNYLKNEKIDNFVETIKNNAYEALFSTNSFVGIQLDRQLRTTQEGKLYFENFLSLTKNSDSINSFKMEEYYLYVRLKQSKNKVNIEKYLVLLGGESRLAKLESLNENLISKNFKNNFVEDIKSKIQKTKYFKIILLTPTNYPPEIEGAKRIAQLTGRPIAFSGWFNVYEDKEEDSKKIDSFPSRLFKLIPAGSVFYYKIDDEITKDDKKLKEFTEKLFDEYWLKPSFFVPEYPYFEKAKDGTNPLGFGLSIIGVAQVEED